jgi:molybdopterin-containing oxidoreductase family membrane subunit
MLEKALHGSKIYWAWVMALLGVIGIGFFTYLYQYSQGLGVTGLSRDVSWGFYIAQLTYLVGVAASGVMLVLPYYLHDHKTFGKLTILGEFMAVSAVLMCMMFVLVDLGQPKRMLNVILFPTPNSILFWDMFVLSGYLGLNIVIGWMVLHAENKRGELAKWVKILIYISIPWAISIHTVTAFLYSGLPGRHFWLTAILAPRFLASAFCAGPAILLLIIFVMRKVANFHVPDKAVNTLSVIITYAMILNVFFLLLEMFTAFYSNIPGHLHAFEYMFVGSHGKWAMAPWMWTSVLLGVFSLVLLIVPKWRKNPKTFVVALITLVASTWIEKGMALVVVGFIPNPLDQVTEYTPTLPELTISLGVYAVGLLVLTLLFKIALGVRAETANA